MLKPNLKFDEYHMEFILSQLYLKMLVASMGILAIQFLLSLVWADFLKPMGIGFIGTIAGIILSTANWKYNYLVPYSHPTLALKILPKNNPRIKGIVTPPELTVDLFTKDVFVSLAVATVVFIAGFYIVQRKSVK